MNDVINALVSPQRQNVIDDLDIPMFVSESSIPCLPTGTLAIVIATIGDDGSPSGVLLHCFD